LARYKIPYPVFNFGAGLERIAMIKSGIEDIRKLVYPHLYVKAEYTDEQLAGMVEVDQTPLTKEGEKLVKAIVQTAIKNANQPSPCQFLAYKGRFFDRNIEVYVYEPDVNTKLIGPAALNTVYVYDGDILGVPKEGLENTEIVKKAREKGVSTGIHYLDAIAALAVASIEKKINAEEIGEVNVRVKMAKLPSDVNVGIQAAGMACITSRNKKIIVKGPVFVGIRANIV
jgi:O-phosphoseryl-tRNA synthetase